MKIATIIFTYNRPKQTQTVLEALSKSQILPQKLIIFQDGVKESTSLEEWEKVGEVISSVTWCEAEVIRHQENKGLAASIIDGVDYAFQTNDAVVVLEDDCVPHPKFMNYMTDALHKYEGSKRVYSVTGYAYPVNLKREKTDAYFGGRSSSQGWGTWKDRWSQFEKDYTLLRKIKRDPRLNDRLQTWGPDLPGYLLGNVEDRCDSWAVFWELKHIEKEGYALVPYRSLIDNIGYDGSGVHCGTNKPVTEYCPADDMSDYVLPDRIEITEECAQAYKKYFAFRMSAPRAAVSKYYNEILAKWVMLGQENKKIVDRLLERGISRVAIWGKGRICDLLLRELAGKVSVRYIIESKPKTSEYQGIEVTSVEKIADDVPAIIVIPSYDMDKIKEKVVESGITAAVIGLDELVN